MRHILPSIRVPTLVLHRRGDPVEPVEGARYIAREIPGAKYVELEGVDAPPWAGDSNAIIDEIEEFLTGIRRAPEPDRVLSTVLFTDIVGSTEKSRGSATRRWKGLLGITTTWRGRDPTAPGTYVESAGDGVLARFDGPARAVRCARPSEKPFASGLRDPSGLPHGRDRARRRRRARYRCPHRRPHRGDGRPRRCSSLPR